MLCFGDSNTWGYVPGGEGRRYGDSVRWTSLLAKALPENLTVIEEGLNGRTTAWDDPLDPDRNGSRQLPWLLESHYPLDLVVIMLGTNDLKAHLNHPAEAIALGACGLVDLVLEHPVFSGDGRKRPQILLVAPAPVSDEGPFGLMFEGSMAKSQSLAALYRRVAEDKGVHYFNAGSAVAFPSGAEGGDGIHLDETGHAAMAEALQSVVEAILCD